MSKITLFEALKKQRELPENATAEEKEKAAEDVYNAYEADPDATLEDLNDEEARPHQLNQHYTQMKDFLLTKRTRPEDNTDKHKNKKTTTLSDLTGKI